MSGAKNAGRSVTALSLRDGTTHVCKNLENPVRELNFVRSVGKHDLRIALSQSFDFGGHNAGVVLRRYDKALDQALRSELIRPAACSMKDA